VGRLVKDRPNSDGTSDIVLHGIVRGEITSELPGQPFRQALVRLHPEAEEHPAVSFRLRRRLLAGLGERLGPRVVCDVTSGFEPGALVDRVAVALELEPEQRVALMQAIPPERRIELLLGLLASRQHRQKLLALIPTLGAFSLFLQDQAP
jgi:Lon protease-like protein